MIVPFVDEGLGNSSYLVDLQDGRALVVDPARDPSPYLREAERLGLRIAFVAETHLHADFVSGGRELAAVGAELLAPADANLMFGHVGLRGGQDIDLGGLVLRAVPTPGHTPEHLSYVLRDGNVPLAVFTGGALIVGSVARTDLIAPDQTEPLARAAYRSVRERLGALPDAVGAFPTHGAGSFCSVGGGSDRVTTIGWERASSLVFSADTEDAFVDSLLAGFGAYPPYFLRLREVNRRGPALFGTEPPALPALVVIPDDALVVDARPFERYAAGHIPGSISIELRPVFSTWLGWIVDDGQPLVFVLDPGQDRQGLVRECLKIGYENLLGELDLQRASIDLTAVPVIDPVDTSGQIVDVRQRSELASGRIPDAVNAELGAIAADAGGVPDGPVTLYCGHGQRAATAASLLERTGRRDLAIMAGGPEEWSRAHDIALARTK